MNESTTRWGRGIRAVTALAAALALVWVAAAPAQLVQDNSRLTGSGNPESSTRQATETVQVALGKSHVLELGESVGTVSIGDPDVADVMVMRARQIYVLGKALGTTNVVLWDNADRVIGVLNVEVSHDLETLKASLHEMLPNESIEVRSSQRGLVVSGDVSTTERMDAALRLVRTYAGGDEGDDQRVLNMMEVGGAQQVMLDVKVAEVSRSLIKRMGINFNAFNSGAPWKIGAVQGGASFPDAEFAGQGLGAERLPVFGDSTPIGPVVQEFSPATASIEDTGIFGSYMSGDFLFNMVIDAAQREGVAKILAEPNLTTLSGQEAHFLAGGEFPIPVPQDLGRVTIEHKEFGVGLRFIPLVLDSGRINLKVDVSVSDLVTEGSISIGLGEEISRQFFVPALATRGASSTVEMGHGQTIAIAGMINESLRDQVDKFPGLGDLPIVGRLFRSDEFVKDQTELVIFVTPRLARPIEQEQARLPTGSFVAPNDLMFYLLGRVPPRTGFERPDDGDRDDAADAVSNNRNGGAEGRFGHDL